MPRSKRERITLQAPVRVKDGSGYPVDTFPAGTYVQGLRNLHASFEQTGGGEYMRGQTEQMQGQQVEADIVGVFVVRLPPVPVLATYQLLHVNAGNKAYGVVSARPKEGVDEGGFRELQIFVKALANV